MSDSLTPLRLAVIHVADTAAVPGSCTVGVSPDILTDDAGVLYTCVGGVYGAVATGHLTGYEADGVVPMFDVTGINLIASGINIVGTAIQFADSSGASIRIGADAINYIDVKANNGGGPIVFTAPGVGGRYSFVGNTTAGTAVVNVTGGVGGTWFNKVSVTTPATGATLTLIDGKTFTVNKTLTLDGTDGTTMTFPATTASVARIDAAQSFTGLQTFNGGVSLGTSGRLDSSVVDGAGVYSFLYKPTVALTSDTTRFIHSFQDSTGAYGLQMYGNGTWAFMGSPGTNSATDGYLTVANPVAQSVGFFFQPPLYNSTGITIAGKAYSVAGGQFCGTSSSGGLPTGYVIGGVFCSRISALASGNTPTGFLAGLFRTGDVFIANSGKTIPELGGWRVAASIAPGKNAGTYTDVYGGYIENQSTLGSGSAFTNLYGLIIEEQTRGGTTNNGIKLLNATAGYKAITIRDQNAWIGSAAAGEITVGGTNFRCASTNQGVFGVAAIARPTNAIAAAAFAANTSGIANDTATWGGYTAGQVVQALQNYGILT